MSRFDCIFFDSGGTLYGSPRGGPDPTMEQVVQGRACRVRAMLEGFGVRADLAAIEAAMDKCEAECQRRLGASYDFHQLMIAVMAEMKLNLGSEVAACLADACAGPRYASWLFPGTREMLAALSDAGLYLGIIANTAWPGFSMDRAFAGVGLLRFFKTRVYSGCAGIEKPDPAIFRLAEHISGQGGRRILYVGDSLEHDVKGAKGVGWSAAMRRSKHASSGGLADFEFERSDELARYVLQA